MVAPCATALALRHATREAISICDGLKISGAGTAWFLRGSRLHPSSGAGTPPVPTGRTATPEIVRAYMSHHHGMALVSIVNLLREDIMVRRFHREPIVRPLNCCRNAFPKARCRTGCRTVRWTPIPHRRSRRSPFGDTGSEHECVPDTGAVERIAHQSGHQRRWRERYSGEGKSVTRPARSGRATG